MISRLTSDIKDYIKYLEENGIYVSIQTDFSEYMMPIVDYYIHRNPRCLDIKSDSEMWDKCIAYHNSTKQPKDGYEIKKCHAGITEAVFSLECEGSVRVSSDTDFDEKKLVAVIKPLCRMVEYLESLVPKNESEITDNELINRALKYIQRNFGKNLTLNEIADFCSFSRSSLCHLFKKYTGVSVHNYIVNLRISHAKELLKISNQSVSAVAVKCGFSDYNYFASCFKKVTGISPSEYRKKELTSKNSADVQKTDGTTKNI